MKIVSRVLLAVLFSHAPVVMAAEVVPEELDEVVVRGTKLWQMREAITTAEKRFLARYNELNTNDDFDVHCDMQARLGTRIKKRTCLVAFYADAQAEFAQALLTGGYAPEPETVAVERSEEFRQAALKVINSDKRLLKLLKEREKLEAKYLEERKKRFKGRLVLFE